MPDWPTQAEAMRFYGDPRKAGWYEQSVTAVPCPWKLRIGDITTDHIHAHKKVADSLLRILNAAWLAVGRDLVKVKALHMDVFDGCFNLRAMRGGNRLSMHSFACAIDWDAEHNPWRSKKFFFSHEHPLIAAFLAEGWVWGGDWKTSPDAMHVQAARVA